MNRRFNLIRAALRTICRTGWRLVISLLGLLLSSCAARSDDIPSVGQPTSHFYRVKGGHVRVEWKLNRTTIPEDEELVATLIITGATNPREIIRPDLRKLDAFETRFVIAETQDPPVISSKEVRFTYNLRPRNRSVDKLPTLPFHYYNPAAAVGKEFPLTTAREVRLTVTPPRPRAEAPAIPLGGPAWLLAYTPRPVSPARPTVSPAWEWIAISLAGPLAALAWYGAWRRIYPDATRLARMRRSRAARRATDAIRRADRAVDPPAAIAAAVLGYLRARFPVGSAAVTPTELGTTLGELGLPPADCDAVADFFRSCDAVRFAPGGDADRSLALDAAALVTRLEAA